MHLHRIVAFSKVFTAQCSRANPVFTKHVQQINTCRLLAQQEYPKKVLKKEKEKLRSYAIERYRSYLENYTKVLENRFPAAMKMYKVFSVGIREFYSDLKKYISLRIKISRHGFATMTRQEIELYQKMPSDMVRILPVLIISAIPFGNYVIFPLAFLKPRKLLCSHFWSIQQRAEFSVLDLQDRLRFNRPVFRSLQARLDSIPDGPIKERWGNVIGLLGSGAHPSAKDVIACKQLFEYPPYSMGSLGYTHLGYLLNMHGLRKGVFRTKKLKYRALLLLEMDRAILKEGGIGELNTEALRNACTIRGLNSRHLSNQNMIDWLSKWMEVSKTVDKNSYSLLLHCPIFFGYNHSQNWMLIY